MIAKTINCRLRVREIGQIRFDVLQSGKIPLARLDRQRLLREFEFPI